MTTTLVRGAAAVTGTALALCLGLAAPAAHAAPVPAPAGADPAPAVDAAAFLAAQPGADHLIETSYIWPEGTPAQSYTDYGVTIDAGYALDAAGQQEHELAAMTDALEASINEYATTGGSRAKLASFLLAQGHESATIDDLVTTLEVKNISEEVGIVGRLVDDSRDFNSPLTQAYAVAALDLAGSEEADEALGFLLDQQCAEGFFRADFSAKDAADQTCDGAVDPTSSVDTTSLAVLMLQAQADDPDVAAALDDAAAWLLSEQSPNGSWGDNANATGLAGWALGVSGNTAAAARAALWLRAHQLANAGSCAPFAAKDDGAVTLDDLGYANAASGMDAVDTSVATRATTQALPALLWAPGGTTAVVGRTKPVRAGSAQSVTLRGAPGDTLCLTAAGTSTRVVLPASGKSAASVQLPAATRRTPVAVVDAGGEADTVRITGLAATRLKVSAPAKVRKGSKVALQVRGLVKGESVSVRFGGAKVAQAKAGAGGTKTLRFVAKKLGRSKVVVKGHFGNRQGRASIIVRR